MPSLCHKIQPFTEPYIRCLLNNKQQAPTLIFINTVPSVSYCSTVMLYDVFNFLSYILLSALPSTSREESQVVVSPGTDSAWGEDTQQPKKTFSYKTQSAVCALFPSVLQMSQYPFLPQ